MCAHSHAEEARARLPMEKIKTHQQIEILVVACYLPSQTRERVRAYRVPFSCVGLLFSAPRVLGGGGSPSPHLHSEEWHSSSSSISSSGGGTSSMPPKHRSVCLAHKSTVCIAQTRLDDDNPALDFL